MATIYGERWKTIKSLSEGGQSHIYVVNDINESNGNNYVLKRFKNIERLTRFKNEIDARLRLNLDYVPKIIDYNYEKKEPYLVEEYFPAGDLTKNKNIFEQSLEKTLEYFLQICEVIKSSHQSKPPVIHRDLKPGNILYSPKDDHIYITDFGICFIIDPENEERFTLFDEQVGSRDFIAPELQRGKYDDIDSRSDIYSLGKLLYWMLTNSIVFREDFRKPEYNMIETGGVQYERVNRILDKMLTEEPNLRYPFVKDVISDVKLAIRLIKKDHHVINLRLEQICLYCGIGKYKRIGLYNPASDGYNSGDIDSIRELGLNPRGQFKFHIFCCDHCGNIQIFRRDLGSKVWEEPNPGI